MRTSERDSRRIMRSQECRITVEVLERTAAQNPKLRRIARTPPPAQHRRLKHHIGLRAADASRDRSLAVVRAHDLALQRLALRLDVRRDIAIRVRSDQRTKRWGDDHLLGRLFGDEARDALVDDRVEDLRRLVPEIASSGGSLRGAGGSGLCVGVVRWQGAEGYLPAVGLQSAFRVVNIRSVIFRGHGQRGGGAGTAVVQFRRHAKVD